MKKTSNKIRKAYNFGGRNNENESVRGYDHFHSKVCLKNKGSLIKIPNEIKGDDDGLIFYHFLEESAREAEKSCIPKWEQIKEGIQSKDARWCAALQKMYRDLKEIKQLVEDKKSELLEYINEGDLEGINKSLGHFKEEHIPTASRILCSLIESSEELERLSILEAIKKIDPPESGVVATFMVYLECLAEKEANRDDLREEPNHTQSKEKKQTKTTKDDKKEEDNREEQLEIKQKVEEKLIEESKKDDTTTKEPIEEKQVKDTKVSELRMDDLNRENNQLKIDERVKADSKPQQPREDDLVGFEEPNQSKGIQDWFEINPLPDKVTEAYIHHPVQQNQKKREREGDNQREGNKRSQINELLTK